MCILITKEQGVNFPTKQNIINCVNSNPDGFAMSYNTADGIVTFKTLDAQEFIDEYDRVASTLSAENTAMLIHARIATHGTVKESNCHCWTGNVLGSNVSFAHNGILPIHPSGDMTDSETFLRDFLEPCQDLAEFLNTIDALIGSSKIAFLTESGSILRFGRFIEEYGIQYSNYSSHRYQSRCADPRTWRSLAI